MAPLKKKELYDHYYYILSMDINSGKDILEELLIFTQSCGNFSNNIEEFWTG